MTFEVRDMTDADVPSCVAILNYIIALGGTTSHETAFDDAGFAAHYLEKPEVINVVVHSGRVVGFQAAFEVEPGVYSIGSFTDQVNKVKGAGSALFAKTRNDCRTLGATSIIARITSDNTGGLAFYSRMGFQPFAFSPDDFTRANGATVDRVVKRFVL